MTPNQSRKRRLCFVLATLGYLVVSLFVLRNVVSDPVHLLPYNSGIDVLNRKIGHFDQSMVISVITRNANIILTEPWNLLEDGQCFPFPQSYTLGEHMFGEGIQMAIPWLLTGDPILAYNLLLVFTLCMPGVAMYLLADHFTRNAGASFIAGLFLLLAPPRIIDGGHPYLHAEFWLPLILLFLHKLFSEDRRWGNAAWLCLFLCLQALETIYVIAGCAAVAGTYGLHLLIHFRSRAPQVLLPLAMSVGIALLLGWVVLGPYFETRSTWDVLSGRQTALFTLAIFWHGTPYFLGTLALVLATIGIVERFARPPAFERADPRLAILAAGFMVIWMAVREIPLPGTDLTIPGLYPLLSNVVPGLDAVRAFFAVTIALTVPAALLCAYGARVLLRSQRTATIVIATTVLSLMIGAERFSPALASWNFGGGLDLGAWEGRPASDDIELIRSIEGGPTFDIPVPAPKHHLKRMAVSSHLLLQSWNPKPSSSCYNSFASPLEKQIHQLSGAFPASHATEALAAVGFDTVLSHTASWWPPHWARIKKQIEDDPQLQTRLEWIGESSGLTAYRLHPQVPIREDLSMIDGKFHLKPAELSPRKVRQTVDIPFVFRNPTAETFRLPPPLAPRNGIVQWHAADRKVGAPEKVRVVWPIALGPGGWLQIDVTSKPDLESGLYRVTLHSEEEPETLWASRDVLLQSPGSETSD